jgi:hypothetical protein
VGPAAAAEVVRTVGMAAVKAERGSEAGELGSVMMGGVDGSADVGGRDVQRAAGVMMARATRKEGDCSSPVVILAGQLGVRS